MLSAQNVSDGGLSYETDRFTTLSEFGAFQKRLDLRSGDLLLTIVGSIGRAAVVSEVRPAVFQRSVAVIRPKAKLLDSVYLYYAMGGASFQNQLRRATNASSQAGVYLGKLKQIDLEYPPLDQQRRIADILRKADSLRRKALDVNNKLDELKESSFFARFGAIDQTLPLREGLTFVTSGSRGWARYYRRVGARFIRSLDVRMNSIADDDAVYVDAPPGAEAQRTQVHEQDVLLTITGSQIGRVAPVPQRLSGSYVSQHVAILRLDHSVFDSVFVSYCLSQAQGQRQIAREQYGQTKPGLNLEQIGRLRVPDVPISAQRSFTKTLEDINRVEATNGQRVVFVEEVFESLCHRAFRGEL